MATKATSSRKRGSDLLKHRYTQQDIEQLLTVGDADEINLVRLNAVGTPQPDSDWDGTTGTWHVKSGQLPALMDRLARLNHVPTIRVIPLGIPVPDMFEVTFEAGAPRHL